MYLLGYHDGGDEYGDDEDAAAQPSMRGLLADHDFCARAAIPDQPPQDFYPQPSIPCYGGGHDHIHDLPPEPSHHWHHQHTHHSHCHQHGRPPHFDPTFQTRTSARRQNRPVEVRISDGLTTTILHCNRDDILLHFPATRQDPFGAIFLPQEYIAAPNRGTLTTEALRHIFRSLEACSRTRGAGPGAGTSGGCGCGCGLTPFELFPRADAMLERSARSDVGFRQALQLFAGACAALDKDGGLGCGEALLGQVDAFALGLMEAWHDVRHCRAVLLGYARVFQPSSRRHMRALRELWNAVPTRLKPRLVRELTACALAPPRTVGRQTFVRALRDMSLF